MNLLLHALPSFSKFIPFSQVTFDILAVLRDASHTCSDFLSFSSRYDLVLLVSYRMPRKCTHPDFSITRQKKCNSQIHILLVSCSTQRHHPYATAEFGKGFHHGRRVDMETSSGVFPKADV